jgi:hypothetical protein
MIDREPTSEAELTRDLPAAARRRRRGRRSREPGGRAPGVGQPVRASVSIPPVSDCLDGTFRIYRPHRTDLADLVELDSMSPAGGQLRRRVPASTDRGAGHRRAWQRQVDDCVGAAAGHAGHDHHPHRPGDARAGRAAPAGRALVAGGRRPHDPLAGAAVAAVRAATARRRRDARRGGIRAAEGRQRRLRIPHDAPRQLRPARHAVAGDRRADGRRERPRASGAGDVRSPDRPRHPLRGRAAPPRGGGWPPSPTGDGDQPYPPRSRTTSSCSSRSSSARTSAARWSSWAITCPTISNGDSTGRCPTGSRCATSPTGGAVIL